MSYQPSLDRLRELFHINEDGLLMWNAYRGDPSVQRQVGSVTWKGYRKVCIDGRSVFCHRIIWALSNGRWPAEQIDHINGDKSDSRPENLRECSASQNRFNAPRFKHGASGLKNVHYHKHTGQWTVDISANRKRHYLGLFPTKELASELAALARQHIHGEFAHD